MPSHWQRTAAFAASDGPMMYRREYTMPAPADGVRRWLHFDGIFYQADVWLDGAYLGDPEGYFVPHAYDITDLSRIGDEHTILVEVSCPPEPDPRQRRNITGIFQNWDGIDRDWNPGGIWRPVHINETGPARVDRFRVLCRDADATRAHLLLTARIDSDRATRVAIRTLVDGEVYFESFRQLARGVNDVTWNLDIADPNLWWPRALGDQPLTDIGVEVVVDGAVSDRTTRRTGLREVAWNDWTCSINGERLFLKGANLLPTKLALAEATAADCRRDIQLVVDAGLDAVRVHGHIALDATYNAADELGILVLQDFPLQWGYHRSVRRAAVSQARAAVDLLGHHPSIVEWSAHNDPTALAVGLETDRTPSRLRYALAHQLPSWNKSVLDRWVKRAIESADSTRAVSAHSGVLPNLPTFEVTDNHFYFGWYHGQVSDLSTLANRAPQLLRFLSEFGAESVPDPAPFIDAQLKSLAWPDLDWADLERHNGLQRRYFDQHVPPSDYATFDLWRDATQRYQAELLRYHIEQLRRMKYRPVGGFCLYCFNDSSPMAGFSILDDQRRPKLAWDAVANACRPLTVVAAPPPTFVVPGDRLILDVFAINDTRRAIDGAEIHVEASWAGGTRNWTFGGRLPPDSMVKVASPVVVIPDTLGSLEFELTLYTPENTTAVDEASPVATASSTYRTAVTRE